MSMPVNQTVWLKMGASLGVFVIAMALAIWLSLDKNYNFGQFQLDMPEWSVAFLDITEQQVSGIVKDEMIAVTGDPFTRPASRPKINRAGSKVNRVKGAAGKQKKELPSMELTFTAVSKNQSLCKINGLTFKEGESGKGFRVIKITSKGVWFSTGVGKHFLATGEKVNIAKNGKVFQVVSVSKKRGKGIIE